jgi:aspartate racemase
MLSSAHKLAEIGAELLVAPCNTIHAAFDRVISHTPLPWLHIAEEVARAAQRQGIRRLGILGTRSTMEGPIYREKLAAAGIEPVTPEAEERNTIDRFIFGELVHGVVTANACTYIRSVADKMRVRGCDAIGLCCTELPLAMNQRDSRLPLLDSTRLLAAAAIAKCGPVRQ